MQSADDKLFERWCRRGDAQALGELFDRSAPELLKLAVHLVGDALEAEDLVQATFLAAIEQRASLDATQPVMPWLCGVLANKARDSKRRAAREIDPERLFARAEVDASQPLQNRELSGEVAKAIDRIDEPYRQVLVLKLRHGMDIADVAHVLERSPATVRVQLHRGLEKLRQLLPASIASAFVLGLASPRGLAAIKSAVLHEASASVAVATSTSVLGGMLVGKKMVLASAAAVALIAVMVWRGRSVLPADAELHQARPVLAQPEQAAPAQLAAIDGDDEANAGAAARQIHDEAAGDARVVRGVVTDGETGKPIAGARLRLFAPRSARVLDLQKERPELFETKVNGELSARAFSDWPFLGPLTPAARFGREPIVVYDYPVVGQVPLAEVISASDGSFALAAPESGGVLECERESYGRRVRAASDTTRSWDVALWRERTISGRVVDGRLQTPSESLHLVFYAVRRHERPFTTMEDWTASAGASPLSETLGVWTTDTNAEGRFTINVAAPEFDVATTTPGWASPLNEAGASDEPGLLLIASHVPAFHFFDAVTHEPVERVHLIGREQRARYVRWSGEFCAPRGMLDVPGDSMLLRGGYAPGTLQFAAWADGYREALLTLSELPWTGVIDVPLERGEIPAVEGWVRRGSDPVAGADVALIGHSPLQWRVDDDWLVDAIKTSADGHFRLAAPQGAYILRVTVGSEPFVEQIAVTRSSWEMRVIKGREPYFEHVDLPASAPLVIDLARTASIEVEIVDADGMPSKSHVIALRGHDGRDVREYTDDAGHAKFVNLSAAKFTVMVPHVSTRSSFSAEEVIDVELARGEAKSLRVVIPAPTGPRHARVVASGVASYTGWRARYDGDEWNELAADGTVPMDLTTESFRLEIASADARRWSVEIPKQAPDGVEIRLDAGESRLRGVLLDDASDEPLAGVRVHAEPWKTSDGANAVSASCVSDAQGRFEFAGLADATYRLEFHSNPEQPSWYDSDSRFKGVSFLPDVPASHDPEWMEIRLGGVREKTRVAGRVVQAANGEALADARLWFACTTRTSGGALQVGGNASVSHTDAAGHFEIVLPRTATCKVSVVRHGENKPALEKWLDDFGAADAPPIELVVP